MPGEQRDWDAITIKTRAHLHELPVLGDAAVVGERRDRAHLVVDTEVVKAHAADDDFIHPVRARQRRGYTYNRMHWSKRNLKLAHLLKRHSRGFHRMPHRRTNIPKAHSMFIRSDDCDNTTRIEEAMDRRRRDDW
jgi:hypothetical protein